ncbi:MAG: rhodanese-like domain-containing protein [bacterium]|nr:rhodanese-like domain-containing protein [bacterium]
MLLKYVYDEHLAQASYFVGCPGGGVALVIDPARNIDPYLRLQDETGLKIIGVAETHIHADFASGGRELAASTGAILYISGHGEDDLAYDFTTAGVNVRTVCDGDTIMVGDVELAVIHTPGHTPEHIIFQITDTGAHEPMGLFTGDALFAGDIGRPDLLDATGNAVGSSDGAARQQYENVQRFKQMPDYLQVWPGHGAGSACGKALGAVPSTTIGYEKRYNPAFQQPNAEAFVEWLLEGQPEPPHYFAQMKRVNRVGAALLDTLDTPEVLGEETLLAAVTEIRALVIDARSTDRFAQHHAHGTLNIPGTSRQFNTWAGWFVDYAAPTYLIADENDAGRLIGLLRAIGVDEIPGYFPAEIVEQYDAQLETVEPSEAFVQAQNGAVILDVRGKTERQEERIPDSLFMPMGEVANRLDELPRLQDIIVQCGSGVRSGIIASLLENYGFRVRNLAGGIEGWKRAGLPVENG